MSVSTKIISLKENSNENSLDYARFFLSYKKSNSQETARSSSHELLSLLKGDTDAIIEINTNLFLSQDKSNLSPLQPLIDFAKNFSLEHRYKKIPATPSQSILGIMLPQKKRDAHELSVFIPSSVWNSCDFTDTIVLNGARYYFTEVSGTSPDILDKITDMTDLDKLDYFKSIVFDLGTVGSMGINTKKLGLEDLKMLLCLE